MGIINMGLLIVKRGILLSLIMKVIGIKVLLFY